MWCGESPSQAHQHRRTPGRPRLLSQHFRCYHQTTNRLSLLLSSRRVEQAALWDKRNLFVQNPPKKTPHKKPSRQDSDMHAYATATVMRGLGGLPRVWSVHIGERDTCCCTQFTQSCLEGSWHQTAIPFHSLVVLVAAQPGPGELNPWPDEFDRCCGPRPPLTGSLEG